MQYTYEYFKLQYYNITPTFTVLWAKAHAKVERGTLHFRGGGEAGLSLLGILS
jgi:hypothetical protein